MSNVILKDITQIIPHRYPMVMIDYYSRIDDDNAFSQKTFHEGDYGCTNGVVMDSILIECVAQTVAAHYGYQVLIRQEKDPVIGMLVSVDKFNFYHSVTETSKIEIFTSKIDEIGPFKIIKGEIQFKKKIVAAGNIKIFNQEKEGK